MQGADVGVGDPLVWLRQRDRRADLITFLERENQNYQEQTAELGDTIRAIAAAAERRLPETEDGPWWGVGGARFFWHYGRNREYPSLIRLCADGSRNVVLDLEDEAGGSPYIRLGVCEVSPDGRCLAYACETVGNESYTLRVRSLVTIPTTVVAARVFSGGGWSDDSQHFFYVTHDDAFRPSQVWRHDRTAAEVSLVVAEADPRFHVTTRRLQHHLVISASSRLTSQDQLVDLRDPCAPAIAATTREEGCIDHFAPASIDGEEHLLVVTNRGAVDFRLALAPHLGSDPASWAEVVAEQPGRRLFAASVSGTWVVVDCRRDGVRRLLAFWWGDADSSREISPDVPDGSLERVPYGPTKVGSVKIAVSSYLDPTRVEVVTLATGAREVVWQRPVRADDHDEFCSERRLVRARDGAEVPVTLVRHRDTALDRSAPCLLYGYGAWETVIEPEYDPMLIELLRYGVVFAHAHVRGGGELGRRWWLGGRMQQKMNTFTDYIDVAEALGATCVDPQRIVGHGRSAGGLLMGAVFSLRPDLWRGIVAEVPFVDPVTTMSDPSAPLVAVEWDEWGNPARAEDRAWMAQWSPFDLAPNVADRPPLLVTTAINDWRVSPWEPARWVHRLRDTGSTASDVVLHAELGPGAHWIPEGRRARMASRAEIYAWIAEKMQLGRAPGPRV